MKIKIMTLLLTLSWTLPSFADVKSYVYEEEGFFTSPTLIVEGKKIEMNKWVGGFSVSESMKSNPTAFAFAEEHERYAKVSTVLVWSGLGAAVAYSLGARSGEYNSGTYWGVFALGFIPGLYYSRKSGKALLNSINAYNGVNRSAKSDKKLNFYLLPSTSPQVGFRMEF